MKMNREEFDNCLYNQDDPAPAKAKADKLDLRKFWFLWVPGGALGAFMLTLWANSGGVFLPAWFVITMLLWGAFGGKQ